jgi:hypothetical protein
MGNQKGSTLMEVVISILLLAMLTTPIMSVALSGRMASGRADRRIAAAASIRRLSESLKAYLTADRALARGPGAGLDGWSLPGDLSLLPAFEPGRHELDPSVWAPALAPFSARVFYTVAARPTALGPQPDVTFSVEWKEP